ncbi:uncharacterized protein G2W53_018147 [Senna tora]|uniref:Endonuclease/exonuclease/phosphatase domain-containing protein n=1 Tax=Senna tora TaxID=362788 RepID=A0A834WN27_9FABA|nr:uncharacterized protein G2W53_018147 [Senna tora]
MTHISNEKDPKVSQDTLGTLSTPKERTRRKGRASLTTAHLQEDGSSRMDADESIIAKYKEIEKSFKQATLKSFPPPEPPDGAEGSKLWGNVDGKSSMDGRGTGALSFPGLVKDLKRQFHLEGIFILETRQSGISADRIIGKCGFDFHERVAAEGFVGGIWGLWDAGRTGITVLLKHRQFMHLRIGNRSDSWLLTVVYASPQAPSRRELWSELHELSRNIQEPWCVVGDFNAFVVDSEKQGGSSGGSRPDSLFHNWINSSSLIDLGFLGPEFTWHRGGVAARLDRALANSEWRVKFPEASVTHLPKYKPFSAEEIKEAGFSMGALKAPGPDGLNPLFFQSQWDSVSSSIVKFAICKPKKAGGLSLKCLSSQNRAFMTKLGWGLIYNQGALWSRVIRSVWM